ncbi:MAG: hypothetical protein ABJD97_16235, partial [Betaproteobacteria bacterium]
DAITKRVIRLKQKALAAGKDIGPARIRRGLRKLNATNPTGSYFDAFFMIDDLPENALRFQEVKVEVEANIQALKKGGGYVL